MSMIHPTLYKKSSTGKTLIWYQEIEGGKYRTIAGQQGGQLVTSAWTVCEGKNIGRSNETTPEQQAKLEVAACYKKKLDQGQYHEDIKNIGKSKYQEPMLAYPIEKYPLTSIAFEKGLIWGQPKLDGCLSGDALVETDKGCFPIKQVVEGDPSLVGTMIKSYDFDKKRVAWKKIVNRMKNGHDVSNPSPKWYRITTDEGILEVTGNHLIWVPELSCWRRVDDLITGIGIGKLSI